jgi:putative ABC transport system permease protein
MDLADPVIPGNPRHPTLPPWQLSYRDAMALAAAPSPQRHVVMFRAGGVFQVPGPHQAPLPHLVRATTPDFFAMFDVPFLFGGVWRPADETSPVIVLSRSLNDRLFGGANSVGRTVRFNDVPFRVVGVLDRWFPLPKFYDLNDGPFDAPEAAFLPFAWAIQSELGAVGDTECWRPPEPGGGARAFLNSDCTWLQMWVELPSLEARQHLQSYIDAYWAQQHQAGRFLRPRNNHLTDVSQWLADNDVVGKDDRLLLAVAFAFLGIALINTVVILLAKFLGRAALMGVRRALGASRKQIMLQHLVEVSLIASLGALAGLGLAALGLRGVHALYGGPVPGGYQELTHFDLASVIATLGLAVVCAVAAGIYPAWRVGRLSPTVYLKNQ